MIHVKNNEMTHAAATAAKSLQSCPTLCNPIDSSPLGSSVPGILQARVLEWGAIAFSDYKANKCLSWNLHLSLTDPEPVPPALPTRCLKPPT